MLDPQIERERYRVLQPIGGEARGVQGGEPARVEPFLDAGNALVVDVDEADDVGDLLAVRIDALVLVEEPEPRDSEVMDLLLLLGRDLALEPDEAALGGEPIAQLAGVEIGHHRGPAGMLPVGRSPCASMSTMIPMASTGGTRSNGRSGNWSRASSWVISIGLSGR